jgi:hypothetical protein
MTLTVACTVAQERVIGTLLGVVSGPNSVTITNSFPVPHSEGDQVRQLIFGAHSPSSVLLQMPRGCLRRSAFESPRGLFWGPDPTLARRDARLVGATAVMLKAVVLRVVPLIGGC